MKYLTLFALSTLLFFSCSKEEEFTGTLTVMQKDAYNPKAGALTPFWPPHTTTVFEWDNGRVVQLNHGTAPEETDVNGNKLLTVTKTYTFKGTKAELEDLQRKYTNATCDYESASKFLGFGEAKTLLEQALIEGLKDFVNDSLNFQCSGTVTKQDIITYLDNGEIDKVVAAISSCNWTLLEWKKAFDTALKDAIQNLGHDLNDYHVCNNDAAYQVRLINNFITNRKDITTAKDCNGPQVYFIPPL